MGVASYCDFFWRVTGSVPQADGALMTYAQRWPWQ